MSGLEEYWVYQFVVIASTTAGDSDERRSGNYTTQEGSMYSRNSMARTLMAHLPRLFRTHS